MHLHILYLCSDDVTGIMYVSVICEHEMVKMRSVKACTVKLYMYSKDERVHETLIITSCDAYV